MKKKNNFTILIIAIILILFCVVIQNSNNELRSIKSEKELERIYNRTDGTPFIVKMLTLPFSVALGDLYPNYSTGAQWDDVRYTTNDANVDSSVETKGTSSKDYSKTNVQVEGVDEADIIKTDGDYIYSISDRDVVITNAKDPSNLKVESRINNDTIPVDIILYKNKLVVISTSFDNESVKRYNYYYRSNQNTIVSVYNIDNKKKPGLVKSLELNETYNTSRCIEGKLYIFSSGYLRMKNNKINREYKEDNQVKEIELSDIKYIKDHKSSEQTLIAEIDLNNTKQNIKVSSYLIDLTESYVSRNNIYLMDEYYSSGPHIADLFGIKGVIGFFQSIDDDYDQTKIYKFEINKDKGVIYKSNTKVKGSIINQYSFDEKDDNLRIALHTDEGSRVAVLDKNLHLLGETESVAKGETMYAARFIGDKAYLVTYKNTDPLFVIDLSNPHKPLVSGELKIPGYSTYLHPYDETHLIGIGRDTEEVVYRDDEGKVTSSWTRNKGMKMSLFDISDINNPKEINTTTIGDSYTYSSILTNPKALLFSKEKHLLAIPINGYSEEDVIEDTEEEVEEDIAIDDYISEGYIVYDIDEDGFKRKGTIVHDEVNDYYYRKQIRGLYIENNLYTVSENQIKVNKLSNLEEISKLKVKGEK